MLTRRWISLLALGALLAASGVLDAQGDPQSGPRLELSQRKWNFGQLWTGDPCEIEIELRNVGDATLKILNIKSSCGCAAARPRKRELAPGETDVMTVTYDTKKFAKVVKQTITVVTNDPVEPEIRFELHGEVWNVFDAKPYPALGLGKVKLTSRKSKTLELTNNLSEKAYPKLRPIDADAPFEIKLEEIDPGRKYRLFARIKPPLKPGDNRVKAVIETGVERLPTMSISVSARALERVAVWPERLRVVPSQKKAGTRRVRIYYVEEQPVEVTEILCDLPSMTVRMLGRERPTALSEFAAVQLQISVPPFNELPEAGVTLEIHTNDPDPKFQKFVVPIEKIDPQKQKQARQGQKPD